MENDQKETKETSETTEIPAISDEVSKLKSELEEAVKKRDEYLAGWQRAKADFINYQKDESRRQELMVKFAAEQLMDDVIVVLDSFDLAIASHAEEAQIVKALRIIKGQFLSLLVKWGLKEINVEPGQILDPNFHEAVEAVPDNAKPDNTILEIYSQGYLIHGRVLRPAKVKVVAKPISGSSADHK